MAEHKSKFLDASLELKLHLKDIQMGVRKNILNEIDNLDDFLKDFFTDRKMMDMLGNRVRDKVKMRVENIVDDRLNTIDDRLMQAVDSPAKKPDIVEEKIISREDLRIGDKVKAKTTWGFPCKYATDISGVVIFDKNRMAYCIDGVIENCPRSFPVYGCWDFEKIDG